ncbi:hypothetical protein FA454_22900 [Pseudomonas aeruginosa]|nr:hypothetical protein T266_00980 [Pseudomonas aeruginosa VRFPA05]KSQ16110.1 hypothetical protein APB28_22100 [Pseudomonas aeruginosa]MCO1686715.1 hypothetical protein [Pseudomonas aeruginosa]MCO1780227.1 hypothetical protein [Pseudomonas aeruginosa]MCO1792938.1 hypothetical protein [Pseudomonas aeruginosa]
MMLPVSFVQFHLQVRSGRFTLIQLCRKTCRGIGRCLQLRLQLALFDLQLMAACFYCLELNLQRLLLSLSRSPGLLCLLKLHAELADLPPLTQGGDHIADNRCGDSEHPTDHDDFCRPLASLHDHS